MRVLTARWHRLPLPPPCLQLLAGFLGWFAPSNIAVPALGGQSLFGAFSSSIGNELAHFPTVGAGGSGG